MAELFILSKTKHKQMSLRFIICSYFFLPIYAKPMSAAGSCTVENKLCNINNY